MRLGRDVLVLTQSANSKSRSIALLSQTLNVGKDVSLLDNLDFPAEFSENSAGNLFPPEFAKDFGSQV